MSAVFNVDSSMTGQWCMRWAADAGGGGALYFDGDLKFSKWGEDLWWGGSWGNINELIYSCVDNVGVGYHSLEIYGMEGCCDGAQQLQVGRLAPGTTNPFNNDVAYATLTSQGSDIPTPSVGWKTLDVATFNVPQRRPIIRSITYTSLPTEGGGIITITGAFFFFTQADSTGTSGGTGGYVYFGENKALKCSTYISWNSATIKCTVPKGEGTILVDVYSRYGDSTYSKDYITYDAPKITTMIPTTIPTVGGLLTVSGTNFGTGYYGTGSISLTLSNAYMVAPYATSTVTWISASQFMVSFPSGKGPTVFIQLTIGGQTVSSYISYSPPQITQDASPQGGTTGGNAVVTVYGSNFGAQTGNLCTGATCSVLFGTSSPSNCVVNAAHTQITCNTPAGWGSASISLTTGGQTAPSGSDVRRFYTYGTPSVLQWGLRGNPSSFSFPTNNMSPVLVKGANFAFGSDTMQALVAGVSVTATAAFSSKLVAIPPAGTGFNLCIRAQIISGAVSPDCTTSSGLLLSYDAPVVTGIQFTSLPTAGLGLITLTGLNFGPTTGLANVAAYLTGSDGKSTSATVLSVIHNQVVVSAPAGQGKFLIGLVVDGQTFPNPRIFTTSATCVSQVSSVSLVLPSLFECRRYCAFSSNCYGFTYTTACVVLSAPVSTSGGSTFCYIKGARTTSGSTSVCSARSMTLTLADRWIGKWEDQGSGAIYIATQTTSTSVTFTTVGVGTVNDAASQPTITFGTKTGTFANGIISFTDGNVYVQVPSYLLGTIGTATCSTGSMILEKADCQAAAVAMAYTQDVSLTTSVLNSATDPFGCYFATNKVYWNVNAGAAKAGASPVCLSTSNPTVTVNFWSSAGASLGTAAIGSAPITLPVYASAIASVSFISTSTTRWGTITIDDYVIRNTAGLALSDTTKIPIPCDVNSLTAASGLKYYNAPAVTSVTVAAGGNMSTDGGSTVNIYGINLGLSGTVTAINLASGQSLGTCASTTWADGLITCTMPKGYGSASLQVSVGGQVATSSGTLRYNSPVIPSTGVQTNGIAGAYGPTSGGQSIVISGTDFYSQNARSVVKIGGTTCTILGWASNLIQVSSPIGSGKNLAIVLTADTGTVTGSQTFTFAKPMDGVNTAKNNPLNPTSALTGTTQLITITGSNFGPAGSVVTISMGSGSGIGTATATLVTAAAHTQIVFTIPTAVTAAAGTNIPITIDVSGVASDPLTGFFSFTPPTVTKVTSTGCDNSFPGDASCSKSAFTSGNVCCPSSCGPTSNCNSSSTVAACNTLTILASKTTCLNSKAPCIMMDTNLNLGGCPVNVSYALTITGTSFGTTTSGVSVTVASADIGGSNPTCTVTSVSHTQIICNVKADAYGGTVLAVQLTVAGQTATSAATVSYNGPQFINATGLVQNNFYKGQTATFGVSQFCTGVTQPSPLTIKFDVAGTAYAAMRFQCTTSVVNCVMALATCTIPEGVGSGLVLMAQVGLIVTPPSPFLVAYRQMVVHDSSFRRDAQASEGQQSYNLPRQGASFVFDLSPSFYLVANQALITASYTSDGGATYYPCSSVSVIGSADPMVTVACTTTPAAVNDTDQFQIYVTALGAKSTPGNSVFRYPASATIANVTTSSGCTYDSVSKLLVNCPTSGLDALGIPIVLTVKGTHFSGFLGLQIGQTTATLVPGQTDAGIGSSDQVQVYLPAGAGNSVPFTMIVQNGVSLPYRQLSYAVPAITSITAPTGDYSMRTGALQTACTRAISTSTVQQCQDACTKDMYCVSFNYLAVLSSCSLCSGVDSPILTAGTGYSFYVKLINGQCSTRGNGVTTCPRVGGATVTVTGSNFGPGMPLVFIGKDLCQNVVVMSPHAQVECVLPAGVSADLPVFLVQNGGEISEGSTASVTYSDCPAGYFGLSNSTIQCQPCASGTFAMSSGLIDRCSNCDVGKASTGTNAAWEDHINVTCTGAAIQSFLANTNDKCKDACNQRTDCTGVMRMILDAPGADPDTSGTCTLLSGSITVGAAVTETASAACYKRTGVVAFACIACVNGKYALNAGRDQCDACVTGKYGPAPGLANCLPCDPGTYSDQNQSSKCTACPPGKTQANPSQSQCQDCAPGLVAQTEGLKQCYSCDPGWMPLNTSTCVACQPGTSSRFGMSCDNCPAGKQQPATGQGECTQCTEGRFSAFAGAILCQRCAPGNISGTGAQQCDQCDVGTYDNGLLSKCTACTAGSWALKKESTVCDRCAQGKASDGSGPCTNCSAGAHTSDTGSVACIKCEPGKAGADTGLSSCVPCTSGKAQVDLGRISCDNCPPGRFASSEGSVVCDKCQQGTFSTLGGVVCNVCAPGTYSNSDGAVVCTSCMTGEYQLASGQARCFGCDLGKYANQRGSTGCAACTPGRFSLGAADCDPCYFGTFAASDGASSCKSCVAGKYYNGETQTLSIPAPSPVTVIGTPEGACTDHTDCIRGQKCNFNLAKCEADSCSGALPLFNPETGTCVPEYCSSTTCAARQICEPLTVSNRSTCYGLSCRLYRCRGGKECTDCEVGRAESAVGQLTCSQCEPGTAAPYQGLAICSECGSGQYAHGSGNPECMSCNAGYFANKSKLSDCYPCLPGTAAPGNGSALCDKCAPGKYNPDEAQAVCTDTPRGTYVALEGQTAPTNCSAGSAQPSVSMSRCDVCVPGKYASGQGNPDCKICEPGRTQSEKESSKCDICPVGSESRGPGNEKCYPCIGVKDYAFLPESDRCSKCPEGAVADATHISCLCDVNYATKCIQQENTTCTESVCAACPRGAACDQKGLMYNALVAEPGWYVRTYQDDLSFVKCLNPANCPGGLEQCAPHRRLDVPLCALCEKKYVPSLSGTCQECAGDAGGSWTIIVLLLLAAIILLFVLYWMMIASAEHLYNASKIEAEEIFAARAGFVIENSTPVFLRHYTTLTIMGAPSPKPSFVFKFKIVLGFIQVCLNLLLGMELAWPASFKAFLRTFNIFNLDFFTGAAIGCVVESSYFLQVWMTSCIPVVLIILLVIIYVIPGYIKSSVSIADKEGAKIDRKSTRQKFWSLVMFTLFLFYPTVSTVILRLYQCTEVYGVSYLRLDFSVICDWKGVYGDNAYASLVLILLFPIGIPLFMGQALYKYRQRLDQLGVRGQLGFIYDAYERQHYYWELVEMAYKLIISAVVPFYPDANVHVPMACCVACVYLILVLTQRPYLRKADDALQQIALTELILMLLCAYWLQTDWKNAEYYDGIITTLLIVLMGFFFTYFLMGTLRTAQKVVKDSCVGRLILRCTCMCPCNRRTTVGQLLLGTVKKDTDAKHHKFESYFDGLAAGHGFSKEFEKTEEGSFEVTNGLHVNSSAGLGNGKTIKVEHNPMSPGSGASLAVPRQTPSKRVIDSRISIATSNPLAVAAAAARHSESVAAP